MTYELLVGGIPVGQTALEFRQHSSTIVAGGLDEIAEQLPRIEQVAVRLPYVFGWMFRHVLDDAGEHVITNAFLESRLCAAIGDAIAARDLLAPPLQLRRPDGSIVRTRRIVVEDLAQFSIEFAFPGDDFGNLRDATVVSGTPADELSERAAMVSELEAALRAEQAADSWRGEAAERARSDVADKEPDAADVEAARQSAPPPDEGDAAEAFCRFRVHVMVDDESELAADAAEN